MVGNGFSTGAVNEASGAGPSSVAEQEGADYEEDATTQEGAELEGIAKEEGGAEDKLANDGVDGGL